MTRYTVLVLLALSGCGSHQGAEDQPVLLEKERAIAPIPPASTPKIPADGSYSIATDADEDPVRRMVEVKLKKKVSPEVLREIALKVKGKEKRRHERTAIYYFLPMEFSELAGLPWASTHFSPSLEVKILGLSQQEEDAMRKLSLDHKGKRIGAWLQDNQYKTLDLIYDDGGIKIAEIRSPTERSDSDMIEMSSSTGRRFRKVKGSNIYDVDHRGNLRISNAGGQVFSAATPMK